MFKKSTLFMICLTPIGVVAGVGYFVGGWKGVMVAESWLIVVAVLEILCR